MKTETQMARKAPAPKASLRPKKKTRGDAVLKGLSEAKQDEIAEYGRAHTLAKTVEWLATENIEISSGRLSVFLARCRVKEQMERNAATVNMAMLALVKQDPELTPERVQVIGQNYFSGLAMEAKDAHVWRITQQIELQKGKLELEWQKHRDELEGREGKNKELLKAAAGEGGISGETLEKIEEELKLM